MKKQLRLSLVSAAVLLAVSTTSFSASNYKGENYKGEAMPAAPCPTALTIKDGFYVGLQGGYDSYRTRQRINTSSSSGGYFNNPVLNPTGWAGGILGGYGQDFNNLYHLGAEIFINDSNANTTATTVHRNDSYVTSHSAKVTAGASYGIGLLPGVKLNDASLLYVRLGFDRVRLKARTSGSDIFGTSYTDSNKKWLNGFNYGLGVESAFYQDWSARLEYTHTNYKSFSTDSSKFSPADNQVMAGLIYHIA